MEKVRNERSTTTEREWGPTRKKAIKRPEGWIKPAMCLEVNNGKGEGTHNSRRFSKKKARENPSSRKKRSKHGARRIKNLLKLKASHLNKLRM